MLYDHAAAPPWGPPAAPPRPPPWRVGHRRPSCDRLTRGTRPGPASPPPRTRSPASAAATAALMPRTTAATAVLMRRTATARRPRGTPRRATARRPRDTPQKATVRRPHGTLRRATAKRPRGTPRRATARLLHGTLQKATVRRPRGTPRRATGMLRAVMTGWTAAVAWVAWRVGWLWGGRFRRGRSALRPLTRPGVVAPEGSGSSGEIAGGEAPTWPRSDARARAPKPVATATFRRAARTCDEGGSADDNDVVTFADIRERSGASLKLSKFKWSLTY